ncbi:MAG: DUF2079 domain-containing protein [Candidatus Omnitrophota bacterium]
MELVKSTQKKINIYDWIVFSLIGIYAGILSFVCFRRYYCFDYLDMDLAAYNHILWNIVHGSSFTSILGVNFLGHHAHLILFLFAPLYIFLQSPLTLVFLQIFFLALTAYPLFLIARDELNGQIGLFVVIAYLLYPAMGYTALYEFHVTVFSTAFLTFMFYFFIKHKFRIFVLFMWLALLSQENIALIIIPFGIFAACKKRSLKWWLVPLLSGGFWFLFTVGILIPHFNKDTIQFSTIYRHLGNSLPEITGFIIMHPLKVINIIFTPEKLQFLFKLFAPVCFFSLLDGRILILGLVFLQHLLSTRLAEYLIEYHYDAEMLPFIFISAIYGIKRLLNFPWIKKNIRFEIIGIFLITASFTCAVSFGPFVEIIFNKNKTNRDLFDDQKENFVKMIPQTASVIATFNFLPQLSNRKELYSFHYVVNGFHTLSYKPYVLPENIEYALLDVNDPIGMNAFYRKGRSEANMVNFFKSNKWGIVETLDNILLLKNGHKNKQRLFKVLRNMPQDSAVSLREAQTKEGLMFLGYQELKTMNIPGGQKIELMFFWKALEKIQSDYKMIITIKNKEGQLCYKTIRPLCYRIFPTYAWGQGIIVQEYYSLFVPDNIKESEYSVNISLVTGDDQEVIPFYRDDFESDNPADDELTILNKKLRLTDARDNL